MPRGTWPLVCLVLVATGCSYSLPLGGAFRGRGAPVGPGRLEVGTSFGLAPETAGTLPLLLDELGNEVNGVPPDGSGATHAGAFDALGAAYGFTDWLDVGLSFSRGLHAVARVAGGEQWSVSLSPALFRYSAGNGGDGVVTGRRKGAITNVNLSLLAAVRGEASEARALELYAGAAANRYSAWIESDVGRVERATTAPSVLVGLRALRYARSRADSQAWRRPAVALGLELVGAWLTERGRRRRMEPGLRVYLSIGAETRVPER